MKADRREILFTGAGFALASLAGGCGNAATMNAQDPQDYVMPLEAQPHARTFMQWPVSPAVYDRASLAKVQASIALIAQTIARYEPVVLLAGKRHMAAAGRAVTGDVEIWDIPTDDLWCRDSGPTFVRNGKGELAVANFHFNGWGNKQPHGNDSLIAQRVAERLGLRLIDSGLVGEQGGIEHDGAGTVLAHASCWANPNRNRMPQDEIGKHLLAALGGTKMIWAPGIKGKDITDYHIDALARFVGPGKLLIQLGDKIDPDDPWSVSGHETLRLLREASDASGRRLEIVRLADPLDIRSGADDFVASYVNYYVCNGAVIAAQFGDKAADALARELLGALYPDRIVEMLNIDAIGEAGGGIHCATQQQPVAVRV
jgi:agmatine deiminase